MKLYDLADENLFKLLNLNFKNQYVHLIDGGLGNQMLALLSIYSIGIDLGEKIILDYLSQSEYYWNYNLEGIPTMSNLNTNLNLIYIYSSKKMDRSQINFMREKLYGKRQEIKKIKHSQNLNKFNKFIFTGWFIPNDKKILEFSNMINEKNLKMFSSIAEVSIHIRAGDYKKYPELGKINQTYFKKILKKQNLLEKNIRIFSDTDSEAIKLRNWITKKSIKKNVVIDNELNPINLIFKMSKSDTLILSNSSISWWGGVLSKSISIFYPSPWYISNSIKFYIPNNNKWIPIKRSKVNYLINYFHSVIKYKRFRS